MDPKLILIILLFFSCCICNKYQRCEYKDDGLFLYFTQPSEYSDYMLQINTSNEVNNNRTINCSKDGTVVSCHVLVTAEVPDLLSERVAYDSDIKLIGYENKTQSVVFQSPYKFDKCNMKKCKGTVSFVNISSVDIKDENTITLKFDPESFNNNEVNRNITITDFYTGVIESYKIDDDFINIKDPCSVYKACVNSVWEVCSNDKRYNYSYSHCRNVSTAVALPNIPVRPTCNIAENQLSVTFSNVKEKLYFNLNGKNKTKYYSSGQTKFTSFLQNDFDDKTEEISIKLSGCFKCNCIHDKIITCYKNNEVIAQVPRLPTTYIVIISLVLLMIIVLIPSLVFTMYQRRMKKKRKLTHNFELIGPNPRIQSINFDDHIYATIDELGL